MAFMCGGIEISILGRVDHHALVAPVALGAFLAMLASLRATSRAGSIWWGCVCGLLAGFSVGGWIITPPLYFLPVPMTILALRWGDQTVQARRAAWSCLGSAAGLVLLVVLLVGDLEANPFTLYQPSWFTVVLFVLVPVFVLPFFYRRLAPVGVTVVALVLVGFAVLLPQFFLPLRQALEVASGGDPSYQMASEASSLFFHNDLFTFMKAVSRYTYLFLLAPFVWVAFLCHSFRARDFSAATVLGLSYSFLAVGLLILQRRFGEFAAPAVALLIGWMLTIGGRRFLVFLRDAPNKVRAVVWTVLLVSVLGVAISPLVIEPIKTLSVDPVDHQRDLVAFGRNLEKHLPPVEGPGGRPRYGLNSGWNEAHPLLYITGRPVMVSSFGTPDATEGNRHAFRLLLSSDEGQAYREMVAKRVRFVVVSNFTRQVAAMAKMADIHEPFLVTSTTETSKGYKMSFVFLRPLAESQYMRMFIGDGSAVTRLGFRYQPLVHHRLHLESVSNSRIGDTPISKFKAFELVAGARLIGAAAPGELVELQLPLKTNTGRRFVYRNEATVGPDGHFEFVVPYPTESADSAVVPLGPYLVKVADEVLEATVTEGDVRSGKTINLGSSGS
jgi:hypothetical protein